MIHRLHIYDLSIDISGLRMSFKSFNTMIQYLISNLKVCPNRRLIMLVTFENNPIEGPWYLQQCGTMLNV